MSTLSNTVMRRVRVIHAVRPLFTTTALASVLLLGALWGIGREVWVARVLENLASVLERGNVATYLVSAFTHTDFIVQVLTILTLAAAVWLVRDGIRSLSYSTRTA
jgi:hypothetical protein